MYRARRWILGLENFLIKSLPLMVSVEVKDKDVDYISNEAKHIVFGFKPMEGKTGLLSRQRLFGRAV